jgi:beta-N-acetylhexosaminidase
MRPVSPEGAGRLLVGFDGLSPPPELEPLIRHGHVAGVVIFSRNLESTRQWVELHASLRRLFGETRPIIAVDQEGGLVQRLRPPVIPEIPRVPAMGLLAEAEGVDFEALGRTFGAELAALGFNVDLAPVLDVHSRPDNPIIGTRAFGRTPDDVIARAIPFWRGLEAQGVLGCGKHFPGHGDTSEDSHVGLPVVARPPEALGAVELPPFAAAVEAGMRLIMSAHVVYPALDPVWPATLSAVVIPRLLRGALGFQGVIVSDDLDMGALDRWRDAALLAERLDLADVDLVCVCRDLALAEALAMRLGAPSEARRRRLAALARALPDPVTRWPLPPLPPRPGFLSS